MGKGLFRKSLGALGSSLGLLLGKAAAAPVTYKDFEARNYRTAANLPVPYRLFKPKGYSPDKKYPIMITLHGAGERGVDDSLQLKYKLGLMWADSAAQAIRPSFVFAPQCPPEPNRWVNRPWEGGSYDFASVPISAPLQAVVDILDSLSREFSLDADRVYVSGMSMGGYGAWYLLMKYPDRFAAAVPVCGAGDPKQAAAIKHVPVWAFHAADDNVVPVAGSRDMINALKAAGGNPTYTEYAPGLRYGHDAWTPSANTEGLAAWVLAQSRGTTSVIMAHPAGAGRHAGVLPGPFFEWKQGRIDIRGRSLPGPKSP